MLPRRLLLCFSALVALALPASASAAGCDPTASTTVPDATTLSAARTATVCLVNAERTQRGLRPVVARAELSTASSGLAKDMVARDFFDHVDPDGATMVDRLRRAGWMPRSGSWSAGENIAWAGGSGATPQQIVADWMGSAGHRANILQPSFREIGIGIALGAPVANVGMSAATYVTDFGYRSSVPRGRSTRAHS